MHAEPVVILCPGQGAQAVSMGKKWAERARESRRVFEEADAIMSGSLHGSLSSICWNGPPELLNRTDVSQPALFTCAVASFQGLTSLPAESGWIVTAAAGLSLGEYTALHLAGVFDFATGLHLVAERGRLMQRAAEESSGGMVAIIGADDDQAERLCDEARSGGVLVCANYNAPGQIVLSGDKDACRRAVELASSAGLRATPLAVAGAFHSPHMQPAADGLAKTLGEVDFAPLDIQVWSNVTARPHGRDNQELLKRLLVEQLISPVRWAQSCAAITAAAVVGYDAVPADRIAYHEVAPGSVLRGLMRRIARHAKVQSHEEPE